MAEEVKPTTPTLNPESVKDPKSNPPTPPASEKHFNQNNTSDGVLVKIARMHEDDGPFEMPKRMTDGAACFDVCACLRYDANASDGVLTISPLTVIKVPTDLCFEIPEGYEISVRPRSGLSTEGLSVELGTIDSDYRGEVFVTVKNVTNVPHKIKHGQRIAQLKVQQVIKTNFQVVKKEELSATKRGENGFGSTGR